MTRNVFQEGVRACRCDIAVRWVYAGRRTFFLARPMAARKLLQSPMRWGVRPPPTKCGRGREQKNRNPVFDFFVFETGRAEVASPSALWGKWWSADLLYDQRDREGGGSQHSSLTK